jgi:hypothetical protein
MTLVILKSLLDLEYSKLRRFNILTGSEGCRLEFHCFSSTIALFIVHVADMSLRFRQTYVETKLALKTVTVVQKGHRKGTKKFACRLVLWRIYSDNSANE